ncbi:hypothetical protein PCC79_06400 [Propioniciclava soli]|uniref:Uncharacterized protein n=1 Tax=Propioniciclava soli TaxID=2775081 RepID=A0ABZ3CAJ1_9ACTN
MLGEDLPVDWTSVRDAYGPATGVPELLHRVAADNHDDEAWQDLWGRLCHQGTVYSASFAALPYLARLATEAAPAGYEDALHLLAAIAASTDVASDCADTRANYATEFSDGALIASRNLALAQSDTEFLYGLAALAGLEREGDWANIFSAISDGELLVACPLCGEDVWVLGEDAARAGDGRLSPADNTSDLAGLAERYCQLARRHGRPGVAEAIITVTRPACCSACGAAFSPTSSA